MITESRKKKTKNWEEDDYYDSDEDNFLDRTGTVERKREQRMKQAGKLEGKTETYNSLVITIVSFMFVYIFIWNTKHVFLTLNIFPFCHLRLKNTARL